MLFSPHVIFAARIQTITPHGGKELEEKAQKFGNSTEHKKRRAKPIRLRLISIAAHSRKREAWKKTGAAKRKKVSPLKRKKKFRRRSDPGGEEGEVGLDHL